MLQQDNHDNYILATVMDFIERCFANFGKEIVWTGKCVLDVGREKLTIKIVVKIDEI